MNHVTLHRVSGGNLCNHALCLKPLPVLAYFERTVFTKVAL